MRRGVLSIMRGDKSGHQFFWDRAAILMAGLDGVKKEIDLIDAIGEI